MSPEWTLAYGLAFGVSPEWLRERNVSPEIPAGAAALIESVESQPKVTQIESDSSWAYQFDISLIADRLQLFASHSRRGDRWEVRKLLKLHARFRLRERILSRKGAVSYASEESFKGDENPDEASEWAFPTRYLTALGSNPTATVVTPAPHGLDVVGIAEGEMLIVDTSQRPGLGCVALVEDDGIPSLLFMWDDNGDGESNADQILGVVVGKVSAILKTS